jgi:hypothetical protein
MDVDTYYPATVTFRSHDPNYSPLDNAAYCPVNHGAVQILVGRILTTLDAMGLPDRAHKAARTLLLENIWRWWNDQYENAVTSVDGCLAPITVTNADGRMPEQYSGDPRELSNRWGYASLQEWTATLPDPTSGSELPTPLTNN